MSSCPIPYLPDELVRDILLRLPVKSLLLFRSVCKSWAASIAQPYFIKEHAERAQKDHNLQHLLFFQSYRTRINPLCQKVVFCLHSFKNEEGEDKHPYFNKISPLLSRCDGLVGSCHGIICLARDCPTYDIVLYSPMINTKRCRYLPAPKSKYASSLTTRAQRVGFGCAENTFTHKVVRISWYYGDYQKPTPGSLMVDVYSLKSHSWRKVKRKTITCALVDIDRHRCCSLSHKSITLHGRAHWRYAYGYTHSIISFDFATEKFRDIKLWDSCKISETLGLVNGCLAVYHSTSFQEDNDEMWVMKEYGIAESWTKLYLIPKELDYLYSCHLLGLLRNGEVLLVTYKHPDGYGHVISYDPICKKTEVFKKDVMVNTTMTTFTETLISV